MKQKVKLGVVCLARKTFDYQAAAKIYEAKQQELRRVEEVDWEFIPGLTIEIDEAQAAAKKLAAAGLDGLVIISGTFHLGHLALILAREVARPVLLWAFPELPYDGGKIRLNSVCGVNLNASNLYKAGLGPYDYHVGGEIDEVWIDAVRIRAALARARVGLIGGHAHGFYNIEPRSLDIFNGLGAMVIQYQLTELFDEPVTDKAGREHEEYAKKLYDCRELSAEQLKKTGRLAAAIKSFMATRSLDAIAVRCWPEFAATYGVSPCAAMSLVQDEGLLTACEGDVELALSMIALRALGDEAPFSADLSQVDFEEQSALLWHCGVAPCLLWDGRSERTLDTYFAGGKGVTAGFVLKEGDFTAARIDFARGKFRLLSIVGESVGMDKELKGTYARVKFESEVADVFETIVYNGFAHHVAMGYGSYRLALDRYALMQGFESFGA